MNRKTFWLFLGSLALFLATQVFRVKPILLLIIVGVIFLHECGHILAMRVFGYGETKILFVPFLGALAVGQKEDATLTEKVLIALAGPLPGLVLGVGLAIAIHLNSIEQIGLLHATILALIFINLFNLLPVYPLDGGRMLDLLLFPYFSRLRKYLIVMGMLCFFLLGISLKNPMWLGVSCILLWDFIAGRSVTQAEEKFYKELRERPNHPIIHKNREQASSLIWFRLHEIPYRNLSHNLKSKIYWNILERRKEMLAGKATRLSLSVLYLTSLLFSLIAGVTAVAYTVPHSDINDIDLENASITTTASELNIAKTQYLCNQEQDLDLAIRTFLNSNDTALNKKLKEANINISAKAPTTKQAQMAGDDFADFFAIRNRIHFLRPPWKSQKHTDPTKILQESRARHTYAELLKIQELTTKWTKPPPFTSKRMWTAIRRQDMRWFYLPNTKKNRHLFIQENIKKIEDDSFDKKIIQEFLNKKDYTNYSLMFDVKEGFITTEFKYAKNNVNTSDRLLLDHLGKSLADETIYLTGNVKTSAKELSISGLYTDNLSQTLPDILSYLCHSGFSDVRFDLDNISLNQAISEDDLLSW